MTPLKIAYALVAAFAVAAFGFIGFDAWSRSRPQTEPIASEPPPTEEPTDAVSVDATTPIASSAEPVSEETSADDWAHNLLEPELETLPIPRQDAEVFLTQLLGGKFEEHPLKNGTPRARLDAGPVYVDLYGETPVEKIEMMISWTLDWDDPDRIQPSNIKAVTCLEWLFERLGAKGQSDWVNDQIDLVRHEALLNIKRKKGTDWQFSVQREAHFRTPSGATITFANFAVASDGVVFLLLATPTDNP